jgi:peptidoglycan/LPS O-acetylase OafA/YrhL
MVAALLLPVFHFLDRRITRLQRVGVLVLLMMVTYQFHDLNALVWLFAFYLGLMLPSWGSVIASQMTRRVFWTWAAFASALCIFLLVRPTLHGHGTVTPPIVEYAEAIAAAMVLALILYGRELRCYRVLDHPLVRFYGRISYSLYLCHYLVMYVFATLLFTYAPDGALMRYPVVFSAMIAAVTALGATVLATWSYVWIEKPGIELGKDLVGRVWPKKLVTAI